MRCGTAGSQWPRRDGRTPRRSRCPWTAARDRPMQPDHAVIVPPGGGVQFGNVEFLGLSEHSPRVNVSVITMAPGRTGPDTHVHQDEDDVFYVLDGELTFLLG